MFGFESLWVWNDRMRSNLPWYYAVALNRKPAKYLICKRIPVSIPIGDSAEEQLWGELDRLTGRFLELWSAIKSDRIKLSDIPKASPNLLDLCVELAQRMLAHCNFCRWNCRIDRSKGTKHGTCQLESVSRVSSYFHHRGEELIYRGKMGSGTIFFTSCNMRCAFCLSPDTFVLTQRGPIRISQLYDKAGFERGHDGGWSRSPEDLYVFSHEGYPVKASRIFKHDYSGELLLIEPLCGPPIMMTPEHQVPATEDPADELVKTPAAELSLGHWLAIPRPVFADGGVDALDVPAIISPLAAESACATTAQHRPQVIRREVELSHAGATSFQIADRLDYHPTYVRSLLSGARREGLPQLRRQNALVIEDVRVRLMTERRPGIPAQLNIDQELAEFLGYYCAEGHISKGAKGRSSYQVVLSFGRRQGKLAHRAADLILKLFGIKPRIVERRTTITVELGKTSLALLLRALCGGDAKTKRVPEFLFQAPPPIVEAYLRAFAAGDGSVAGGHLSLKTVSEDLAMGLLGLYLRLGHLPSFSVCGPPGEEVVEGRRIKQPTLYYVKVRVDRMKEGSWRTAERVRYRFGDNYILVPIRRISRIPYSGPVYNLEVNDDNHTYIANFIAVGNCQNGDISTDKDNGIAVAPRQLAAMAWQLRTEGCHNINWVGGEATIHLHTIVEAISLLSRDDFKPRGPDLLYAMRAKSDFYDIKEHPECAHYDGEFNAPMLWNSNFFMSGEAMKILRLLMDIWLPDFKFGSNQCSIKLSRTPWYWETVTENLLKIYSWGEDFTIRHLVMPAHVNCCTKPILDWIKANMADVPINIMDQYHPDNYCDPRSDKFNPKYAEIARHPLDEEIIEAFNYAKRLGLNFETLSYEKNMTGLRATV